MQKTVRNTISMAKTGNMPMNWINSSNTGSSRAMQINKVVLVVASLPAIFPEMISLISMNLCLAVPVVHEVVVANQVSKDKIIVQSYI